MDIKLTDAEFTRLVTYVKSRCGIDLSKKRILIEGRLARTLTEHNFTTFTAYIDMIFADKTGAEVSNFINKITTNHTFFMREPEHFDFMRSHVLPGIEASVRNKNARIWCAASSTGEEPYTMAMVIDEYFGARKKDWDLKILATDISTNVLAKAAEGIYNAETLEKIPASWKTKYFKQRGSDEYQVVDSIRSQIIYQQFNLMDPIITKYRQPFDFISCRNVMIYFDMETKSALIERFYDVLNDGAYFYIGHAESVPKTSRFTYVKPAIYQKIANKPGRG